MRRLTGLPEHIMHGGWRKMRESGELDEVIKKNLELLGFGE